jgi:hypothetical protein
MQSYRAWVIDAVTGSEGVYDFEGPDDLFDNTPISIVRTFVDYVGKNFLPGESVDYELNAALKHEHHKVVTAMGSFILERPPGIPFTL